MKLSLRLIHCNTLKFQDKPILRTGQKSALQHSLFWRYANFSKLMRTVHISMTSIFQCEYCQCFTFKRCDKFKLEIRFRKNLAKLTGSAVRINSKKPKGKKTMKEKKTGRCHAGIWTCIPTSSSEKSAVSNHWAMRPLCQWSLKINTLEASFSAIHTVWTLWSCIYHEFKDTFGHYKNDCHSVIEW